MSRAAAIVVNFNGGEDLPRCLEALAGQTVGVDVILVDCASDDGSRRIALSPPPSVRGLALDRNAGFAGGCAAGLAALAPDVEVVGFFNPDCFCAAGFFAACLARFDAEADVGGVAPRLERPGGELLDSCGQVLTPMALRVRDRGYGEPAAGRYRERAQVLAACGAGMVYRVSALEDAAVTGAAFPVEYFAFWEDLDLGWRVTNAGWRVIYEPQAVAVHRRGGTATPGGGRLVLRRPAPLAACVLVNRWATLLRNVHWVDFALRLPLLLLVDSAMIVWLVARRPAVAPHLLRASPRLRLAGRQRRAIPQRRRLRELPR